MIKLNLTANNPAEQKVKDYLENNVSETLAEKINIGVVIKKDNLNLVNKKTLSGFMNYANEEARKQAEKGARYACIEDATVYGWAIHYFEENSIEEKLFNEDGSEYKPAPKVNKTTTSKPTVKVVEKKEEENKQATLFDFFDNQNNIEENNEEIKEETNNSEEIEEDTELTEEKIQNILEQENKEPDTMADEELEIDFETGEILPKQENKLTPENEIINILNNTLDGKLEVK